MQILRKTKVEAWKKAKKIGAKGVLKKIEKLVGRGGAAFPAAKKWRFAINTKADEKFVICNADEGEPGTFKDKFIINYNPETLIEGILIAANTIGAKRSFIYLRGEYEYLEPKLKKAIKSVTAESKTKISVEIVVGAGAYVCGDETAIIKSIEGFRGHPYYKPPFPPNEGLWGKPTIINNVETLTNVSQAILYDDWDPELRLYSVSGAVKNPSVFELPAGYNLCKLISMAKPKNKCKAVYFGCFGGVMPYCDIELTDEKLCGMNCVIGAYTIIVADETHSIVDIAETIAKFYQFESCGKCTPCREGNKRILDLIRKIKYKKATKEDLETLQDLAENIHETSLCGLGQTSTNHVLTALQHFRKEFEERCR